MFESGPDMKMVIQNLRPLPYNAAAHNCPFSGNFVTTSQLKRDFFRNEMRYRQTKENSKLRRVR